MRGPSRYHIVCAVQTLRLLVREAENEEITFGESRIFYLTNSYLCDILYMVVTWCVRSVRNIEPPKSISQIRRCSNMRRRGQINCAKYASRGTKPRCPLESIKLLAVKHQSQDVNDNKCLKWIKAVRYFIIMDYSGTKPRTIL